MATGTSRGTFRGWAAATLAAGVMAGAVIATPTVAGAGSPAASADLSVALRHDPPTGVTTDTFTFTIDVRNDGPDTAADVAVGLTAGYRLQPTELPEGCRLNYEGGSVICEVGDIGSGSTATVELALRAYGSGVFQLSAVAATLTPDPDVADLVANDQLLVRPGPTQGQRYLTGIIPIILERPADPAGVAYWAARWKAENLRYPRDLTKIPLGLMGSDEYRRLRVRELYQRVLGRAADAPSLTYWVGKVRSGWSYDAVERNLLASREFASKHPGDRLGASIAALYGRPATSVELDQWTAFTGGRGDAAMWQKLLGALQRSTPARDRVITDRITRTLGEPPTAFQRFVWLLRYREGVSTERIWAEMLTSWDVLVDYPYTEDDYAEMEVWDLRAGAPALRAEVRSAAAG